MDATQHRATGFVLPGEDPDELVSAAQSALAAVPHLNATIATLQEQNQQMQLMVQQSKEMVTAMMLQAKELEAQVTTGRLMPVLPQIVAHSGVLMDLPMNAMTTFRMSREITPDGGVTEEFAITFDPAEVALAQGEAQAMVNHSASTLSKLKGLTGPKRR